MGESEQMQEISQSVEQMKDDDFDAYIESVLDAEREQTEDTGSETDVREDGGGQEEAYAQDAPYRVFGSEDEYNREIESIIEERTRESRDILDRLRAQARAFYSGDDDESINSLIDDLATQNAENRGVSREEYDIQSRDAMQAELYRQQIEEQEKNAEREKEREESVKRINDRWNAESRSLREIVPDFDLEKALQNKVFYDALTSGQSVAQSYIMASGTPARRSRRAISQNGAAKGASIGRAETNVDTMSDAEFLQYIERIKN